MRMRRIACALVALCLLAAGIPLTAGTALAAAKYYITVDITNQIVTVYDSGNTGESGIVRQMICSTGKSGTDTPTGTYTLPTKTYSTERTEWYYFPKYSCYAKWATRIVGGILFHSVLYTSAKKGPTRTSVNALGSRASHGCVRLRVEDAKWIAQNCLSGTKCRIYYSSKSNSTLRKKLLSKSFSRSSETYDHYMGRTASGGELARGSSGDLVAELQARLKALGFLNDVVDGKYGPNTENAVKYFQAASGLSKTGKVNEALWKRVFAEDAPTGTYVSLSKGMSGPAVAVLQRALSVLKLYDGAADGGYSEDVAEAVRRYQTYFGEAVTGKADQALQKAILGRADEVAREFGGEEYQLVISEAAVALAKVKGASSVKLRSKASASGKALAKVKKGAEVKVVSKGKSWTKVTYNGKTGYIKNKNLSYYTGTVTKAGYALFSWETPEPEPEATPEVYIPTPEPTLSPTPEIYIPTPEPEATPEVYIPTPEPEATPTPAPDAAVQAAPAEEPVAETELELGAAPPEVAAPEDGGAEAAPGDGCDLGNGLYLEE